MAHTPIATLQTAWNCRWSRPGYRLYGVDEERQPETPWMCVRPTPVGRRPVTDEECATCPHWVASDEVGH